MRQVLRAAFKVQCLNTGSMRFSLEGSVFTLCGVEVLSLFVWLIPLVQTILLPP